MRLTYEQIIEIMDLYNFLNNISFTQRGSIMEFCYKNLKYPLLDKLEKIIGYAFWDCNFNFSTWTAGQHVIQIDTFAFSQCKLDTVDLSNAKITELSIMAFYKSWVKKVILPEGLKIIEEEVFKNSELEEVYIPSTVASIGKDSFRNCTHLQKVHLCRDSIAQNKLKIDQNDFTIIKPKIVLY